MDPFQPTFPVTEREAAVLGVLVFLVVFTLFIRATMSTGPVPSPKTKWHLDAIGIMALVLAPVWLGLIGFAVWALVALATTFPEVINNASTNGDGLRWHVLAFVGLVTALGGLISVPFALVRVFATERQVTAAEEGLITERINKAVENLGAEKQSYDDKGNPRFVPNLEVRIGGIYALERIAQDSPRDHIQVMEILCSYIRENAKASDSVPYPLPPWVPWDGRTDLTEHLARCTERFGQKLEETRAQKWAKELAGGRADIQTALDVIGRRSPERIRSIEQSFDKFGNYTGFRLDLRNTNLQGYRLSEYDFSYARFDGAHLDGADLYKASLVGCYFHDASLIGSSAHYCNLNAAHVTSADFEGANLNGARMRNATPRKLSGASLNRATEWGWKYWTTSVSFEGSTLKGADFSGERFGYCSFVGADMAGVELANCRIRASKLDGARHLGSVKTEGTVFEDMTIPPELPRSD